MPPCSVAFKEWSIICDALARGDQTLILRKGGIEEGRDGFRVAHDRFWLYPTRFHASRDQLAPALHARLDDPSTAPVAPGEVTLALLAEVTRVVQLDSLDQALRLTGLHGWSDDTVTARFHYRRPGLFLLVVRIHHLAEPHRLLETPDYAGCKSWVELDRGFDTTRLTPVLTDTQFQAAAATIESRLHQ